MKSLFIREANLSEKWYIVIENAFEWLNNAMNLHVIYV